MKGVMPALVWLLASAAPGRASPPAPPAEQFVQDIYRVYASPDAPSSIDPKLAPQTYSRALLTLIQRDRRDGEVGKLDSDPLCDCQDPDGLRLSTLQMKGLPDGHIRARVGLRFAFAVNQVELLLVRTPAGWRVDDVTGHAMKSLRHLLTTP